MPKILPDREIEKLIGSVIINGSEDCIKSNSIDLRLGSAVRFLSTNESVK